ncbi:MAG: cyclase [Chlorobium sp.]|nr:MAG: cyclase [Chlorobium sp.]
MKTGFRTIDRVLLMLTTLVMLFVASPIHALPVPANTADTPVAEKAKLLGGDVIVSLASLDEGVTGVTGYIYIAAPPEKVWEVITDYDNHKNFVPNVLDSGIISDNGNEKVMFEKGKSGLFLFSKKVYTKMRVWGERSRHLYFQQIEGDFKVYRGEWILSEHLQGKGTFLTYRAEVKPDFFAPGFAVKNVQERDCPRMMVAMKKQAEASLLQDQKRASMLQEEKKSVPVTGSEKVRTGHSQT